MRGKQTQAAKDVLAERERQKSAEGWTPEHDDAHSAARATAISSCCRPVKSSNAAAAP